MKKVFPSIKFVSRFSNTGRETKSGAAIGAACGIIGGGILLRQGIIRYAEIDALPLIFAFVFSGILLFVGIVAILRYKEIGEEDIERDEEFKRLAQFPRRDWIEDFNSLASKYFNFLVVDYGFRNEGGALTDDDYLYNFTRDRYTIQISSDPCDIEMMVDLLETSDPLEPDEILWMNDGASSEEYATIQKEWLELHNAASMEYLDTKRLDGPEHEKRTIWYSANGYEIMAKEFELSAAMVRETLSKQSPEEIERDGFAG